MGADSKVHGGSGADEYAVIVGIEQYSGDLAEPLQGPSLDALRFARWLRRRGVPAEHLLVLENKCDKWQGDREQEYARIRAELRHLASASAKNRPLEISSMPGAIGPWRSRRMRGTPPYGSIGPAMASLSITNRNCYCAAMLSSTSPLSCISQNWRRGSGPANMAASFASASSSMLVRSRCAPIGGSLPAGANLPCSQAIGPSIRQCCMRCRVGAAPSRIHPPMST